MASLSVNTAVKLPTINLLSISLLIAMSSLLWLLKYEVNSVKEMRHIISADFRSAELRGIIAEREEAITMAIRMAVLNRDKKWEERYQLYRPILDNAIAEFVKQ